MSVWMFNLRKSISQRAPRIMLQDHSTVLSPIRGPIRGRASAALAGAATTASLRSVWLAGAAIACVASVQAAKAADAAGVVTPASGAAASSAAGDAAAEIMVTGRHRSEDPERVPTAVTAIGGALLADTNTNNISQLSQLVPSVQFTFFNARNANINIRGLGNNVGLASDGLDPGVGFYVDQVYYDRPATATFDLIDIDHVEVLRGPQGTLYGKNTTAGGISVSTAAPSFKPEAQFEVTGGNYGYFQAKGSLSGPLIDDKLAGRISAVVDTREGVITNAYTNDKVNAYRNESLRGQLLFTPDSNFKLRVIADYSRQITNCCDLVLAEVVSPPNGKNFLNYAQAFGYTPTVNPYARQADSNSEIHARQETGGISAEADWTLSKVVFTSITAWRFWNWWPANDADYTPLSVLTAAQNGDYQNQFSQEFRVASAGANRIDYVAGLYFFREQINAVTEQQYGNAASYFLLSPTSPAAVADGYTLNANNSFDTTSYAAFGQATWHVTSRWNVTGGLRYSYDDKRGSFDQTASGGAPLAPALAAIRARLGGADAFTVTSRKGDLSGQANLSYQATDAILTYVNYARGYKSAALNLVQLPPGASAVVAPESIDSVEVGVKARLFDRRLTLNADYFWEDDRNYQANITTSALAKQYLANVPDVRSQGVEVDAEGRPTDNISFYASGSYDDAVYASYADGVCGLESITQVNCNLSGKDLAGVPRWSASAGGEYRRSLSLGAREVEGYFGADYTYRSAIYSAATDSIYSRLPTLNLVNARLGLRSTDERWNAFIWAKNLFAQDYFTYTSAGVGNTGAVYAQLGDPRTWGVTLRFKY